MKARIGALVIGIHCIFLWKIQSTSEPFKKPPTKKIAVRYREEPKMQTPIAAVSVKPKVKEKEAAMAAAPAPEKPPVKKTPEKKIAEAKKQTPAPTPTKKQIPAKAETKKPKPTPAAPTSSVKIPDHLLKELEESLQNVEKKPTIKSKKKSVTLPNQIMHLEIDQKKQWEIEEEQNDYGHYLISHLQNHLQLPEHGEVKIALTLKRDGSVIKVQVLKSESEKNRVFLELHLPKMAFPHFPFDKQENTFTLTFCNQ